MKEATIYIFSASGLAKLGVGDYGPPMSKRHPFMPEVVETYDMFAKDISLWKGQKYVHNVNDRGKMSKGRVVGLKGPGADMALWTRQLDEFERSFGMKKGKRWFRPGKRGGIEMEAIIYYLPGLDAIGDKDGELIPMTENI